MATKIIVCDVKWCGVMERIQKSNCRTQCVKHFLEINSVLRNGPQCCDVIGCKDIEWKTKKCRRHFIQNYCDVIGCGKLEIKNETFRCETHFIWGYCDVDGCEKPEFEKKTNKCLKHGNPFIYCNMIGCEKFSVSEKYNKCFNCIRIVNPLYHKHKKINKLEDNYEIKNNNRCPNCIDWIDSHCANKKYDNYCARCFKHLFPDDIRSQEAKYHRKELIVRNTINENFNDFIHDTKLYTGNCKCSHRRRIDHRKLIGNTILAIETDEFGHRGYNKYDEEIRYDDLYMIHSGKWIFIRFNPDSNVSTLHISYKLDKLIDTIHNCIERIQKEKNTDLLEIIKLFC